MQVACVGHRLIIVYSSAFPLELSFARKIIPMDSSFTPLMRIYTNPLLLVDVEFLELISRIYSSSRSSSTEPSRAVSSSPSSSYLTSGTSSALAWSRLTLSGRTSRLSTEASSIS